MEGEDPIQFHGMFFWSIFWVRSNLIRGKREVSSQKSTDNVLHKIRLVSLKVKYAKRMHFMSAKMRFNSDNLHLLIAVFSL